jgi:hypothetical protein
VKYPDGQIAHLGDRVRLWSGVEGTVVCSLDTQEFSDQYPVDQWRYLKNGVLIHSTKTGLIHYLDPEPTFQLLGRREDS